ICILVTGAQKLLQGLQEGRLAKFSQPGAAACQSDQLIGAQRFAQGRKRIAQHIGDVKDGGYWQHRGPFRPNTPKRRRICDSSSYVYDSTVIAMRPKPPADLLLTPGLVRRIHLNHPRATLLPPPPPSSPPQPVTSPPIL